MLIPTCQLIIYDPETVILLDERKRKLIRFKVTPSEVGFKRNKNAALE